MMKGSIPKQAEVKLFLLTPEVLGPICIDKVILIHKKNEI